MSVQTAIRAKLLASAGVTSIVGTQISMKVSPTSYGLPRITINLIDTTTDHHLGGASTLAKSRVQVDCWADKDKSASDLAAAVRSALDTYRGTSDGLYVNYVSLDSESDDYLPPTKKEQDGIHRTILDFSVWHEQSVPSP